MILHHVCCHMVVKMIVKHRNHKGGCLLYDSRALSAFSKPHDGTTVHRW